MSNFPSSLSAAGLTLSGPSAAAAELAAGRPVVLIDDSDPARFAGVLVLAAVHVSARAISELFRQAGGWPCLALTAHRCEALNLVPAREGPALPMIDAIGVTNGTHPADQARTMLTAIDPDATADALISPGHVKVLCAAYPDQSGTPCVGAAVDLARSAGTEAAAMVAEILDPDGFAAGPASVARLCRDNELHAVAASAVAARARDEVVERVTQIALPTSFGEFELVGYRSLLDDSEHVAIVKGDVAGSSGVLVYVHDRCLPGDVFHSLGCGCGERLDAAFTAIEAAGTGIVVYDARARDTGPTHAAPRPEYEEVAAILVDLGPSSIRFIDGAGEDRYGIPIAG